MDENARESRLIDALRSNPEAVNAVRVRTRITVQLRWVEIEEALAADFPLLWIWKTLRNTGALVGSYQTFCREVAKHRERQGASVSRAPVPDRGTKPPAQSQPAVSASSAEAGETGPSSDVQGMTRPAPPTSVPREPLSKHPLPKDAKFFRPSTPEERIQRREKAKESIARREAEAKAKEGDPQ